jgi:hypothetical protein
LSPDQTGIIVQIIICSTFNAIECHFKGGIIIFEALGNGGVFLAYIVIILKSGESEVWVVSALILEEGSDSGIMGPETGYFLESIIIGITLSGCVVKIIIIQFKIIICCHSFEIRQIFAFFTSQYLFIHKQFLIHSVA